jgi:hypothetical protein
MFMKLAELTRSGSADDDKLCTGPPVDTMKSRKKYVSGKLKKDIHKRMMTLQEVDEWIEEAVAAPEKHGRCKLEPRFTFMKFPALEAIRTTSDCVLKVQQKTHSFIRDTPIPPILMTACSMLADRLPRAATPVEFCGSMGFLSALLTELNSVQANRQVLEAVNHVNEAFPYGDIDLSVHIDDPFMAPVAQATIDNVVCEVKGVLDRLLFDDKEHSEWLQKFDPGDGLYSPFNPKESDNCRANCCQILAVDKNTVVRVDTPVLPGVARRMRFSPLYISTNTSIKAGFTLTRLMLCIKRKDSEKRVGVPLLDISLSVTPKRPCCATTFFGKQAMAASAKAVCEHLEIMAGGEGDPAKLERRRKQLAAARTARRVFKSTFQKSVQNHVH